MSKKKTAKDLGIPSNYRLSSYNIHNIVRAARIIRFSDEVIAMGTREAKLLHELINTLYPADKIKLYQDSLKTLLSSDNETIGMESEIYHEIGGHILGDHYSHSSQVIPGIVHGNIFKEMITNIVDRKELNIVSEKTDRNMCWMWIHQYCKIQKPVSGCDFTGPQAWANIPKKLQRKITKFFEEQKVLKEKAELFSDTVRNIAHNYTSTVQLCIDAPQFISYVRKASVYNKHGKKCTDVSTFDMIKDIQTI